MSWVKDATRDSEDEFEDARNFFDRTIWAFDKAGLDTAESNLRRYREGVGGTRNFTKEELFSHSAFAQASDRNRSNFEAKTFVGKTDEDEELNHKLRNMKDGETLNFTDYFNGKIGTSSFLRDPSAYFAFGRSNLVSSGNFQATRNGRYLTVKGEIVNRLGRIDKQTKKVTDELYDFNAGQIGNYQANFLERTGEARPFYMHHESRQPVEVLLEYGPNGELTIERVDWGPLQ